MAFDTDVIVVGAGAVGLATGYALAQRGRDVTVIEREALIGEGISARNSEVIHAGLYYEPGSLRARLCVTGRRALYNFCDRHRVSYKKCGKLIVATEADETPFLESLVERGRTNDVEGLSLIDGKDARRLEPRVRAATAAFSAQSGVFDSHAYMVALRGRIEDAGGTVAAKSGFRRAVPLPGGGFDIHVEGADAPVRTRLLIVAAGLGAQRATAGIEGYPQPDIPTLHYGKGVYFSVRGKPPFSRLVYPLPVPGALGTHYRCDLAGRGVFGPDLRFVPAAEYSVEPERADSFIESIRPYWPAVTRHALVPDYAGIRPKIHGPGEPQPDFRIDGPERHGIEGLVTLFGIESPGLTASLAIGEEVAGRLSLRSAHAA